MVTACSSYLHKAGDRPPPAYAKPSGVPSCMKALVLNALGRGFDFEDVDIAAPIGREVLVDVRSSGLCHTDLLFATHDFVPTPAVLGHEVAGIVAAVGPDVAQLRVGVPSRP